MKRKVFILFVALVLMLVTPMITAMALTCPTHGIECSVFVRTITWQQNTTSHTPVTTEYYKCPDCSFDSFHEVTYGTSEKHKLTSNIVSN